MTSHEFRVSETVANSILSGRKRFDVQPACLEVQTGDEVNFVATDIHNLKTYHEVNKRQYAVTYVYAGRGLKDGYMVLGFEEVMRDAR